MSRPLLRSILTNCQIATDNRPESGRNPTLDVLRVVAMFFVMLIHNSVVLDQPGILFFKSFIGCGSVPAFFILSGYLGARKLDLPSFSFRQYAGDKWRTLIIPYAFWNILVLILVFGFKIAGFDQLLKGAGSYFSVEPTANSITRALFGIGRLPIVYQFWFLRDLIVVSFAAWFICRYCPRIPLLAWLLLLIPFSMVQSLGFFMLGYSMRHFKLAGQGQDKGRTRAGQGQDILGPFLYCMAWAALGVASIQLKLSISWPLIHLGSAAFLFFLSKIICTSTVGVKLAVLGSTMIFVYAVHEPTQTLLMKTWKLIDLPWHQSFLSFFLVPLIVFAISLMAYQLIRRFAPRLLRVMTGYRV